MRVVSVFLLVAAAVAVLTNVAFGDEPVSPQNDQAGAGVAAAQAEEESPLVPLACPECAKAGGLCTACEASARAYLAQMADEMCDDCTADKLCPKCSAMVDAATEALRNLKVRLITEPPRPLAYLESKAGNSMDPGIGQLIAEASKQGLMNEDTVVATVYPDVMVKGYGPDTVLYQAITLPEGAEPQAPLKSWEWPGGRYMQVEHWGDYANLEATWWAALAYAHLQGLEPGTWPAAEAYMTDPQATPMEKWLTLVYVPLATPEEAPAAAETQN